MGYVSRCAKKIYRQGYTDADAIQDLVSRLSADDAKVNLGVLEVAHSIFKRWRPLFSSDGLYTEINHVLSKFGQPFVQLLAVSHTHSGCFSTITDLSARAPTSRSKSTKTTR